MFILGSFGFFLYKLGPQVTIFNTRNDKTESTVLVRCGFCLRRPA